MTSRQNNLTSRLTDRQTDNKQSNRQDKNIQKRNGQTEIQRTYRQKDKKETNCKNLIYVA